MKQFKFLSEYNKLNNPNTGRYVEVDERMGILIFDDGTNIQMTDATHPHRLNNVVYDNPGTFNFWWSPNYEAFEHENERYVSNYAVKTYIGPICSFHRNYDYERCNNTEGGFYPRIPVIRKISCNGNDFIQNDLAFSDNNMWVEIQYKRFLR